jgi:hypothetical protein
MITDLFQSGIYSYTELETYFPLHFGRFRALRYPLWLYHGSEEDFDLYDRYIIPGVGHAGAAMNNLNATGLVPAIKEIEKTNAGYLRGNAAAYLLFRRGQF